MKPEDVTDEMLDAAQAVADQASLFGDPWNTKRAVLAAAINAMPQTDAQSQIDALKAERDALRADQNRLRGVLEILARLGHGDKYGSSTGNMIARAALAKEPR